MNAKAGTPSPQPDSLFRHRGVSYLAPFLLVSSLFFLWGFAHSILEVLNPHFQDHFQITKTKAALVQAAVYGGYFCMSLPVGLIIKRRGYRAGILTGLLLYGAGALLFVPGSWLNSFWFFVLSLFVIGCGLTCLETSANPYTTKLGDPRRAEVRINLSQSLNGIGWIAGPWVGGMLLFTGQSIALPYAIVALAVLLVACLFTRVRLPRIEQAPPQAHSPGAQPQARLFNARFTFGLAALFLYVAAQTGVNSFFISYMREASGIGPEEASRWLAFGGMGLFAVGRLCGGALMNRIQPRRVLTACAFAALLATAAVIALQGQASIPAFFVVYASESIMFPTIFSMALRHSEGHTETASSALVMTIAGGALSPLLMGHIADTTGSVPAAFAVPLACYAYIALYALTERER